MKRPMPDFAAIAKACHGKLVAGESHAGRRPTGISTDTRFLKQGELFVALKGERFDGHAWLSEAVRKGASGAVISTTDPAFTAGPEEAGLVLIKVRNTLQALQDLALRLRRESSASVIAITGSYGKTLTKDFLASILGREHSVVSSHKSYNNEIGVPLTLFRVDGSSEFVVLEMGSRGAGHIRSLVHCALPDIGVVTNIGQAHIQSFKTLEGVARAKGELLEGLPASGAAVLNADDRFCTFLRELCFCRVITFGLSPEAEVRAENVSVTKDGAAVSFNMMIKGGGRREILIPLPGRHNVFNALAAGAAALAAGATLSEIEGGLMNAIATEWRMEMIKKAEEITIINDAYNANPASMQAALEAMYEIARESRAIAVLGDMAELGSISEEAHFKVGEMAVDYGTDILITVGRRARVIARSAQAKGLPKGSIFTVQDIDDAAAILRAILEPGDVVLIKGSRFLGLERLIELVA